MHVRNVSPPASTVRAFPERIPFPFRSHATRVLVVFSCYIWTRLLLSGYRCAQLTTGRSSLLSFLLGAFVRERLVRVLALDPTVSKQLYMVGIGLVSAIASWPSDIAPPSLTFVVAPKHVNVVCLLSSLPHSKDGIYSFFGDIHSRLDLDLVPQLFYFLQYECSSLWFCFRLLPPM